MGSVHQGSHIFNGPGRGLQCVPNALCSLLKSTQKLCNTWTTSDIDEVLHRGNMLYTQIGKIGKLLLPSDIPKYITVDAVNYEVHERLSHIGSFTVVNEEFAMKSIDMMNDILTEFSHFLLCIGDSAISVIHTEVSTYYIYHSHSRDIAGFPVSDGTAIFLTFDSLKGMNNYINILAMHLNADKFELTPIEIKWKFLNKDIILAINRQSEALHVAAACDQVKQLCSNVRQAQMEEKINYATQNQVPSKELHNRSRTIEHNHNISKAYTNNLDYTETYNLENTLKNMYEKEMKRKRRNEYMRKYMAQKRQDEKRQTQWKTQQELPINGNIYETKSSRQIHLKNVEREKIKCFTY